MITNVAGTRERDYVDLSSCNNNNNNKDLWSSTGNTFTAERPYRIGEVVSHSLVNYEMDN